MKKHIKRGSVTKKLLIHLFVREGLSGVEIAKKLGADHVTIQEKIRSYGIRTLQLRYVRYLFNKGLRQHEIADKIHRDQAAVSRMLRSVGIDASAKRSERTKETLLASYGVDNCQKMAAVREKTIRTNLTRYGYKTPLEIHNSHITGVWGNNAPAIIRKITETGFTSKDYTFPSGRTVRVQGYEGYAIDILLQSHDEKHILPDDVPAIRYYADNKWHWHIPDIYLSDINKIVEIKSTYTFRKTRYYKEKSAAALKQGYEYETWIIDNGELIEVIK